MNYAKQLAIDKGGTPLQEYPAPFKAVASVFFRDNLPSSSVVTLDQNASTIEVGTSGGQGVVIRWVPLTETASVAPFGSVISSGATANFDHFVPPATYRRFVLPKETGGAPTGAVGSINGLYQRIAISNAGGPSSVLLTQY